jgi:hypothetical protein
MRPNSMHRISLCMMATVLSTSALVAQTVTGSVTGSVTDASGAVIAGATVVAHDLDTGVDSPVTTNASGAYRIQFLPIGHYQVSIEANGFTKETLPPFTLEVLQTANFNVNWPLVMLRRRSTCLRLRQSSTRITRTWERPLLQMPSRMCR